MKVSDDVTLLWSDDNRGNIRRIPIGNEPNRSGGSGMYYHFDYVGDPRNYKWINTIQLQKTWEQMTLAYDRGIENIWIANVGDLKALVCRNLYESPAVPADYFRRNFLLPTLWPWPGTGRASRRLTVFKHGSPIGAHDSLEEPWPKQLLTL